jgi:hypothetical protein
MKICDLIFDDASFISKLVELMINSWLIFLFTERAVARRTTWRPLPPLAEKLETVVLDASCGKVKLTRDASS